MKVAKLIAALFGVAGVCAAALCVHLALENKNASPVLVEQPESAREQVEVMMDAVSRNDYAAASQVIKGNPVFGADRTPADQVSAMIWNAFVESVSYELVGELYATDSGVAQNIVVTTLDMGSVTANLKERSEKLLEERVSEAEDPHEVYDENNEYREDFVMKVLYDAAVEALKEDAKTLQHEVTINMIYENGSWWIVPDSGLLNAISGGILK